MKEQDAQAKLSLKLQAYQYLKTKILNCEYRPNEFLNEQKLCAEMGNISRTPMRDALGRLEQEGLITILPKKGLMVSGITEEDVHSMFEMRLLVEPYALRTYGNAIPREQLEAYTELMHHSERIEDFCKSDDDFHELLMSTLPNKYLRSAYDRITGLNTRFRIMTGKVSMINQEQTCEEHLQILDAALAGDWDGAAMALQHRTVQQTFCLLSAERFRMAAACALAIISGIVIYNIRTAKPAGLAVRLFTRGEKRQAYFSTLLSRIRSLSRFLPAFSRNFSSRSSTVILLRAAPFTSNTMRPASIIRVRLPSSSA